MRSSPPRSRFAAVLLDDTEDPMKRNANTTIHSNSNHNSNNNNSQRSRRGNHNTNHNQYQTATEEEAGGVSPVYAFATDEDALPPVSVSSSTAASSTGNTMCCAKSLKDSLSQDNSSQQNSSSRRRRAKSPLSCLTVNFRSKHKETPSQSEEPLTPKKNKAAEQQYSLQQPKQKSTAAGMNSPQRNSHTREYYHNDLPEASPRKVYQRLPESDRCKTPTPSYSFQPILLEAGDETAKAAAKTTAEPALINQKKKGQHVHKNNNNNNHQFPQYHSADRPFQHQNHYHHHASSHPAFPVDHQDAHSVANTSVSSSMSYLERTRSVLESIKKEKLQRRAAQLIQEQEQLEKERQSDQKQQTKQQKGIHHFQEEKIVSSEQQSRVPPIEMEDLAQERIQASHGQQTRNDRFLDVPVKQHQANSKELPSTQWKSESDKEPTTSSTEPTMDKQHVSSAVSTNSSSANGHGPISTRVQEVLRRSKRRSMSPKNETLEQRRRGRSLSRTQSAWKAKQQQSNNTSTNSTQSISSSEQESSPPSIVAQSSSMRRKSSRSRSRADVARNKAQLLSGKHHENTSQASNDVKEESHDERGMNTTQDSGIIDENVFGAPFHENPFHTASAPELTTQPSQQRQEDAYWSFGNPVSQEFKQEMTRGPVPPSEEPSPSPQESPGKHSSCEKSFISGLTKDSTTVVSSLEASTMSGGPIARERSRSRSSSQKARHRSRSGNRLPNRSEVLKRAEANAKVLSNWEGNDVEVESFKSVQRPEAEDGADPNLAPLTPVRQIARQQSRSKLAAAALRISPQRPPPPPPSASMTMDEAHTGNADDDKNDNVAQDEVNDNRSELESLLGQIDKYGDKKRVSQQTEPPLECFEEVFSISAATTEDEDVEKPQKPARSSTSSYKADQLLGDLDSQISVPTIEDDEYGQGDSQASSILKIHHDDSTISSLSNPTFADSLPSESTSSSPPHPVVSPPSTLAKAMFNIQETSTDESQYKEDIQNYIGQMALFKDYQLRHDSLPAPEQPSAADVIPQLQETSLDTTITGNDDDDEEDEVIEHIPLSRTETVPQEWKHHAAMEDERNTTLNTSAEYSSMSEAIRTVPRADFTTRAIME